jgi:hypothetical protein
MATWQQIGNFTMNPTGSNKHRPAATRRRGCAFAQRTERSSWEVGGYSMTSAGYAIIVKFIGASGPAVNVNWMRTDDCCLVERTSFVAVVGRHLKARRWTR